MGASLLALAKSIYYMKFLEGVYLSIEYMSSEFQ